ncbi:hypothetical protein QW131_34335 [Roseibium salinum]|nr:hypothetical protein [Roseibium salinum]
MNTRPKVFQGQALAAISTQETNEYDRDRGEKRGIFRIQPPPEESPQQHRKGKAEMPSFRQHLPGRHAHLICRLDTVAAGDQVDLHEDAQIVEHCRKQRRGGDDHVGNVEKLGHQEGGRPP